MGLTAARLAADLHALGAREPALAAALARHGHPTGSFSRPRGAGTLLRTILGQQVSVTSADTTWARLLALVPPGTTPGEPDLGALAATSPEQLRTAGLSRQKAGYVRSLAELVSSGALALHALPADDEAAIHALTQVRGIGRWSAEIYLLFAEGRTDIWPAGDLAVQIEVGIMLGLPDRPTEAATRALADAWRPYRGAAAVLAWHHYTARLAARGTKAPL